jgi:hypothetical protein
MEFMEQGECATNASRHTCVLKERIRTHTYALIRWVSTVNNFNDYDSKGQRIDTSFLMKPLPIVARRNTPAFLDLQFLDVAL